MVTFFKKIKNKIIQCYDYYTMHPVSYYLKYTYGPRMRELHQKQKDILEKYGLLGSGRSAGKTWANLSALRKIYGNWKPALSAEDKSYYNNKFDTQLFNYFLSTGISFRPESVEKWRTRMLENAVPRNELTIIKVDPINGVVTLK